MRRFTVSSSTDRASESNRLKWVFMWYIEKIVSKGDYNYAIVKNHPRRTSKNYVLEHIIVMENHLKRLLNINEVVHHIDGIKKNNTINNLQVMDKSEHSRLHQLAVGRKYCSLKCPYCKCVFEKPENKTHLNKGGRAAFCSRKCNGSFSREIQKNGLTHDMEISISENILKRYRKFQDEI